MSQVEKTEKDYEPEFQISICETDEHMLDPLETIRYSLNEIQVTYGSVVKIRDAP